MIEQASNQSGFYTREGHTSYFASAYDFSKASDSSLNLIEFVEYGLPGNASWQLGISNDNFTLLHSYTVHGDFLNVSLPDGKYTYAASATVLGVNLDLSGSNFTVTDTPLMLNVTFPHPFFNVTFIESGLPIGSYWYLDFKNANGSVSGTFSTNETTFVRSVPNGTYGIQVRTNLGNDNISANFGFYNLSVLGHTENYSLVFPPLYKTTFIETNLEPEQSWNLYLFCSSSTAPYYYVYYFGYSNNSTVNVYLPNGTCYYSATNDSVSIDYHFNISGTNSIVTINFPKLYPVNFVLTGSLPGIDWSVYVSNSWNSVVTYSNLTVQVSASNSTSGTEMTIPLPNGTYQYLLSGYYEKNGTQISVQASKIDLTIAASQQTVSVHLPALKLYTVTFWTSNLGIQEFYVQSNNVGQKTPQNWTLSATSNYTIESYNFSVFYSNISSTNFINASLPNGTYQVHEKFEMIYNASPTRFTVNGNNEVITLKFPFYPVKFKVPILPPNTVWSLTVGGQNLEYLVSSENSTITLYAPNGTYYCQAYLNYSGIIDRNFTVYGAPTFVTLYFPFYNIIFYESGLIKNSTWTIYFNGSFYSSVSNNLTFPVGNGSYSFQTSNTSEYTVSPNFGYVVVIGGNVSVNLTFKMIKSHSLGTDLVAFFHSWYGILSLSLIVIAVSSAILLYRQSKLRR
jgi:hypothetical protein